MKQILINIGKTLLIFIGGLLIFCWSIFGIVVSLGGTSSPVAYAIVFIPLIGFILGAIYQKVSSDGN